MSQFFVLYRNGSAEQWLVLEYHRSVPIVCESEQLAADERDWIVLNGAAEAVVVPIENGGQSIYSICLKKNLAELSHERQ